MHTRNMNTFLSIYLCTQILSKRFNLSLPFPSSPPLSLSLSLSLSVRGGCMRVRMYICVGVYVCYLLRRVHSKVLSNTHAVFKTNIVYTCRYALICATQGIIVAQISSYLMHCLIVSV